MKQGVKRTILKKIVLGVTIIMCLNLFSSCGGNKYNAYVIEKGVFFTKEFLQKSKVKNAFYKNESWNAEEDELNEEYLYDETSQKTRNYIIKNQDEFSKVFTGFPQVNLKNKMILINVFSSVYGRSKEIEKIELLEKKLTVEFKIVKGKPGYGDASMPQRRFLLIKMDALDFEEIVFVNHTAQ